MPQTDLKSYLVIIQAPSAPSPHGLGFTAKNPNCTCSASKFLYGGQNYLLLMYWDARKKLVSSEPIRAPQGVRLRVKYELRDSIVPYIRNKPLWLDNTNSGTGNQASRIHSLT